MTRETLNVAQTPTASDPSSGARGRDGSRRFLFWLPWVLLIATIAVAASSSYFAYVGATVLITAILATTLNLSLGFAGLMSLGQMAFYGIGAYATAILTQRAQWPYLLSLVAGVLIAAVIAMAFGYVAIKFTRGLVFGIVSFAMAEVVMLIAQVWFDVTGGPAGMIVSFVPEFAGWRWDTPQTYLWLLGAVYALCLIGQTLLARSGLGLRLLAVRDDSYLAESLGARTFPLKLGLFTVGAMIAALTGGIAAPFLGVLTPNIMAVTALVSLLGIVYVGGIGSVWGPVVGTMIFVLPPILFSISAHIVNVVLGAIIVVIALFLPRGLFGRWRPEKWLRVSDLIVPRRVKQHDRSAQ